MKLLIFFFIAILAFSQQTCPDELYKEYLANYSKPEPTDAQTWAKKKARFCQVLADVIASNQKNLTYTLAINQFSDLLKEQIAKIVSVSFNPQSAAQKGPSVNLNRVGVNAASINWNTLGKVTSIKDQGTCGCCWAFTIAALYESFLLVKGADSYDLSQQYLLECTTVYTKNVLGTDYQSNCNGGFVDDCGSLAENYGIPLQSTYPYLGTNFGSSESTPTTDGICDASPTITYNGDPSVTNFLYYNNVTDTQLQTLLNEAPVGILIYADNTGFMSYSSGIYSGCPSSFSESYNQINHAVLLVGYDASGNWIVKNQWSTGWGDNGYITIDKNRNCALSGVVFQFQSTSSYSGDSTYQVTTFYTQKNEQRLYLTIFLALVLIMGIIL